MTNEQNTPPPFNALESSDSFQNSETEHTLFNETEHTLFNEAEHTLFRETEHTLFRETEHTLFHETEHTLSAPAAHSTFIGSNFSSATNNVDVDNDDQLWTWLKFSPASQRSRGEGVRLVRIIQVPSPMDLRKHPPALRGVPATSVRVFGVSGPRHNSCNRGSGVIQTAVYRAVPNVVSRGNSRLPPLTIAAESYTRDVTADVRQSTPTFLQPLITPTRPSGGGGLSQIETVELGRCSPYSLLTWTAAACDMRTFTLSEALLATPV